VVGSASTFTGVGRLAVPKMKPGEKQGVEVWWVEGRLPQCRLEGRDKNVETHPIAVIAKTMSHNQGPTIKG